MIANIGAVFCGADESWMEKAVKAFQGAHISLYRSVAKLPVVLHSGDAALRGRLEDCKLALGSFGPAVAVWACPDPKDTWDPAWGLVLRSAREMRWPLAVFTSFSWNAVPPGAAVKLQELETSGLQTYVFWNGREYSPEQLEEAFLRIFTEDLGWYARNGMTGSLERAQKRPIRTAPEASA